MTKRPTAYRPCVGMMIINKQGKVLVGRRIDSTAEAWQMPQGGVDEGEDLRIAALRELREEIGTDDVTILAESTEWLHYDLPENLIPQLWGGQFCGQKQWWFLMQLNSDESAVNIHTEHAEFNAVDWVDVQQLPSLIVPFKRELYTKLVALFAPLIAKHIASQ